MPQFRISRPRVVAYYLAELVVVFGVVAGLAQLTPRLAPVVPTLIVPTVVALGALFCVALVAIQAANLGDDADVRREMAMFFCVCLAVGLVVGAGAWVMLGDEQKRFPALVALEGAVAVPLVVALWRGLSRRLNLIRGLRERVLILGTGETARQVCRWIAGSQRDAYGVVGFADEKGEGQGTVLAMGVRIQTDYESLARFCPRRVDRVIVALDEKRRRLPVRPLMEVRLQGIAIEDATSFFERTGGKIAVETMLPSWLIFSEGFRTTRVRMLLKRFVDIILSLLLLLLTLPVMILTAVAVRLDSRGPVFYRQERLGRDGRPFRVMKFRSMLADAERESGPTWTQRRDPRITVVGAVIRKLRIDELPQLVNVLRGEMSFVGPRPERDHFVRQLEEQIPYYGLRMILRPGITGWAQVKYGYGATVEDSMEKLKYDLYYIKNHNLLLDLWIVLKTFSVVLLGRGR